MTSSAMLLEVSVSPIPAGFTQSGRDKESGEMLSNRHLTREAKATGTFLRYLERSLQKIGRGTLN